MPSESGRRGRLRTRARTITAALRRRLRGAGNLEYGILLGLIATTAIVGVSGLGSKVSELFGGSANALVQTATDAAGVVAAPNLMGGVNATLLPPSVLTTAIPGATIGTPYSAQLAGSDPNAEPLALWALATGALPAGLNLAAGSGLISGTPLPGAYGTAAFSVVVSDAAAMTSPPQPLTLPVAYGIPTLTTTALPAATDGTGYTQTLAATDPNGVALTGWALSAGSLPPGLSLSPATGVIAGIPAAAAGAWAFAVVATDAVGQASTPVPLSIAVAYAPPTVLTATLPAATDGSAYAATLAALDPNASSVVAWALTGALPAGLSFNAASGVLSGTPDGVSGAYPLSLVATDGVGQSSAPKALTLSDAYSVPTITTASLGPATDGTSYSATLAATDPNGSSLAAWALVAGSLPPGLSFNATGVISGLPAAPAGSYPLGFTTTDSAGQTSAVKSLALATAYAAPSVTTATLAAATNGAAYTATLAAADPNAAAIATWAVASGSLPAGLSLTPATGVISGTPAAAAGLTSFAVVATDSAAQASPPKSLAIAVAYAAPTITTTSLAPVADGASYTQTLAATDPNARAIAAWTLTAGTLPNGLALNAATGVISGTSIGASGPYPLSFTATDAVGQVSAVKSLAIFDSYSVPTVTTASLPPAPNGTAYAITLAATDPNAAAIAAWALASGSLPAGLSLAPATGVIAGTPVAAPGTASFAVVATDSDSQASSPKPLTIVTSYAPPSVTTASLGPATDGTAYTATLAATDPNAAAVVSWALVGSLPAGLSLASATGVISGTPTGAAGSFAVTVAATDAVAQTSPAKSLALVSAYAAPSVTTASLAALTDGAFYTQTLAATDPNGAAISSWTLASGTLPSGLSLAATGVLSGTSSGSSGTYAFTVVAGDAAGQASSPKPLTIASTYGLPSVTTSSLPAAAVYAGYTQTLAAADPNGAGIASWALVSGGLPPGISLTPATGVLAGTPTHSGAYTFAVAATDADGKTSPTQSLTLSAPVAAPLITTATLPTPSAGGAYSQTLAATDPNGAAITAWAITSGALPAGLGFNTATGVVAGTPTVSGAYAFAVHASDALGQVSAPQSYSFTIAVPAAPAITTAAALPSATWNTGGYSLNLAATDPAGLALTWALAGGAVPTGMNLSTGGALTGTPAAWGTASFTLRATDSAGATATQAFSLYVAPQAPSITTSSLPNGNTWTNYSANLAGFDPEGTGLTYALVGGALPNGVSWAANGALSGVPSQTGSFTPTFQITDGAGASATRGFSFSIAAPQAPTIATAAALPNATTGTAYSVALSGSDPQGLGLSWSLASGSLPAGLTLSGATLSGTPTAAGTVDFALALTDSAGASTSQGFSMVVAAGNQTINASLSSRQYGVDVGTVLLANGWNGSSPVAGTLTLTYGARIGSESSASPALTIGTFPAGSTITLVVAPGAIVEGRGGRAGIIGSPNGQNGGDAIHVSNPNGLWTVSIVNNGGVYGGGGGGGAGMSVSDPWCCGEKYSSSPGGGGAGIDGGSAPGGYPGTSTAGGTTAYDLQYARYNFVSGAGGGPGQSGHTGKPANSSGDGGNGGAFFGGGAPGYWIVGRSNVSSFSGSGAQIGKVQ